jgi:hypothetical protein
MSTLSVSRALVIIVFFLTASRAQERPAATVEALSWLAGCWENSSGTTTTEEVWMRPAGGTMLGMSRTVRDGRTLWHEFLQIREREGAVMYIANPSGQKEAAFTLTRLTSDEALFENPGHDFPQRIRYVRVSADSIVGRIEGTQQGREREEVFPMRRGRCE